MKTFAYTGYDRAGKTQKGLIEAVDIKQAREKTAAAGIFAETVQPAELTQSSGTISFRSPFSRAKRAFFYDELSSLMKSGLPLTMALEVMLRAPDLAPAGAIVAGIRDKIREGGSLADSIAAVAGDIHPTETAFIAAGEKTGELAWALKSLADFIKAEMKLRERIITALIYPAIIAALAFAIAVGLLGFTVPRLAQVLSAEMQVSLPLVTRIMIGLGKGFVHTGPFLIAALIAAVFIVRRIILKKQALQIALDRKLFGVPIIGKCYSTLTALRFSRTLSLLLRGGVPLVESVSLAGNAAGSCSISAQSAREAEAIKNGSSLSEAVGRIVPLGPLLSGVIQIGENTGALAQVLKSAEERYQDKWEQQLARIMAWIEPGLILCVGLFVLLVVISILLPILSLNRQIM